MLPLRNIRAIMLQRGAALITSLIILLVLTVLGISAMQSSSLQENIVGNLRDKDLAMQSAETALKDAENNLSLASAVASPKGGSNLVVSGNTIGPVLKYGTIPTDLSNSAFDTSVWNSANAITYSTTLANVSAQPSYIIEFMQLVKNDKDPWTKQGVAYYRITARGVGSSPSSVVLLQETYGMYMYP